MSCSSPYLARPAFWMACSIASSTSSRSMPFSRATMSATCSISRRGISAVVAMLCSSLAIRLMSLSRPLLGEPVFFDQRVGHLELGPGHGRQRHFGLLAVIEAQFHNITLESEQRALETAAALDRFGGLQPGDVARPTGIVLGPGQRPVDPGRAHFQSVGARDWILDVKHGRQRARNGGAALDIHL